MASVVTQLDTIAQTLASAGTLSVAQRKVHRDRMRRVPSALVDLVLTLADENGGELAGMKVESGEIRATRAEVASARAAALLARRVAAILEDGAMEKDAAVCNRIFATYRGLRRWKSTPAGAPFARVFEQMATMVRDEQKPKRVKRPAKAKPARA